MFGDSADRALWLALLAPQAPRPEDQPALNAAVRWRSAAATAARRRWPRSAWCRRWRRRGCSTTSSRPPRCRCCGRRWPPGATPARSITCTLDPLPGTDTTAGLTRPGTLRLPLPDGRHLHAPSNDVLDNPAAGVGDTPPRLDDEGRAARLVAWLRLRPRPGAAGRPPAAGVAGHQRGARSTSAPPSPGACSAPRPAPPTSSSPLPQGSVDADTLAVEVEEPGRGYLPWARVDDLAAIAADPNVARDAPAYELDAAAGMLRFGDGVRGRVPERGMRVRLAHGRFGGGAAGNLPPGTLAAISARRIDGAPSAPLKVLQPLALQGGADAETLAEAERRIPALLRHRDRAVTAGDYRRLAREVPGVAVGRVEVLPRFKPRDRRFEVRGVVSVLALPAQALPASSPRPAPTPTRGPTGRSWSGCTRTCRRARRWRPSCT